MRLNGYVLHNYSLKERKILYKDAKRIQLYQDGAFINAVMNLRTPQK
jgi:hypothetical protein